MPKRALSSLVLAALLALAPLACSPDEPVEPDDRVTVKLSFDEVTYFEGAVAPRKMMERVKNQTRSIFTALRRADVLVTTNQQVDMELNQLRREPVTVVDPATGATRQATRVHFRYVSLAQVHKALADKGELDMGVLHSVDDARAEGVLTACTANGERERAAVTELWTVFDASLPSCVEAMAREQAALTAARRRLAHPDREVVPAELGRVYLPLATRVRRRQRPDAGAPAPAAKAPADSIPVDPRGQVAVDPAAAVAPAEPPPEDEAPRVVLIDKEQEQGEDAEDEHELRRQARAMGGDMDGPPAPPTGFAISSSPYLAPNYAILYVAIIAFVLLLVGQQRRRSRR